MSTEPRNKLGTLYDRTLGKLLPAAHFFALLVFILLDVFVYFISNILLAEVARGTLALPIDDSIPLISPFILVYLGCYLFWLWGFLLAARESSEQFFNFFTRVMVSLLIALCFFVFFPLTIERPAITGDDFFSDAMRFLYQIDPPHNLFPSLHCFFSWIVYVQIRGKKEYPLALRLFFCLFAIAVFFSTLFTRQHYLLDVVGGIALAELSGLILLTPLPHRLARLFLGLDHLVFSKKP